MSSVITSFPHNSTLPRPGIASHPTYSDSNNDYIALPFTYDKRTSTLDVQFNSQFTSTTNINNQGTIYISYSKSTAPRLVLAIGNNLKSVLEEEFNADAGSISMVENPIVLRAVQVAKDLQPDSVGPIEADLLIQPNYEVASNVTYLFRKPLVVRYTQNSGADVRYGVLASQFEGNT